VLIILAIIWTIPTLGTLITSLRPADDAKTSGWWTVVNQPDFTFNNYREALGGTETTIVTGAGEETVRGENMTQPFLNSVTVTIPAVIIPLLVAAFAAYGFA
jgi:alpha-glucoside transport system permease protein